MLFEPLCHLSVENRYLAHVKTLKSCLLTMIAPSVIDRYPDSTHNRSLGGLSFTILPLRAILIELFPDPPGLLPTDTSIFVLHDLDYGRRELFGSE